jgi:hypothetical protein
MSSFKEEITFHNLTEKPLKLVWKADAYENDHHKGFFFEGSQKILLTNLWLRRLRTFLWIAVNL